MTAFLVLVSIAVAFYIGWEWAHISEEPDPEDPPFSINEMIDLHGELRDLGPYDQEAWER